jgi:hypothetical protein
MSPPLSNRSRPKPHEEILLIQAYNNAGERTRS